MADGGSGNAGAGAGATGDAAPGSSPGMPPMLKTRQSSETSASGMTAHHSLARQGSARALKRGTWSLNSKDFLSFTRSQSAQGMNITHQMSGGSLSNVTSPLTRITRHAPVKTSQRDIAETSFDFERFQVVPALGDPSEAAEYLRQYPGGQISVHTETKEPRTILSHGPLVSEDELPPHVVECLRVWREPWTVVEKPHREYKAELIDNSLVPQRYETDLARVVDPSDLTPFGTVSEAAATASDPAMGEETDELNLHDLKAVTEDVKQEMRAARRANRLPLFHYYDPEYRWTDTSLALGGRVQARPYRTERGVPLIVEPQSLVFDAGSVEPFFCTLSLYDVGQRTRVSELFHFNLNTEETLGMLSWSSEPLSVHRLRAMFHLVDPHPNVYLVLHVHRVLVGDPDQAAAPYLAQDLSTKDRTAFVDSVRDAARRLGDFRQAFVWAAVPLFNDRCEFLHADSGHIKFKRMYRDKPHACEPGSYDSSLCAAIAELKDPRERKRRRAVAGWMRAAATFDPETLPRRLDPMRQEVCSSRRAVRPISTVSMVSVKSDEAAAAAAVSPTPAAATTRVDRSGRSGTFDSDGPGSTIEVRSFPAPPIMQPEMEYEHIAYVSPRTVNLSNFKGKVSARNLAMKVQLLDDDSVPYTKGLEVLASHNGTGGLVHHVFTPVHYHSRVPAFNSEVKVMLPTVLTPRHHLLFTLYHVSCQKSKKGGDAVQTPVGYAVLPLISENGVVAAQDHVLPVAYKLDSHYMKKEVMASLPHVDGMKPLLHVHVNICSSIISQDACLNQFWAAYSRIDTVHGPNIAVLERVPPQDLMRFQPVIFNQLFQVMCRCSHNILVVQQAFKTMVVLLARIQREDGGQRPACLATYIEYAFDNVHASEHVVYEQLCQQWLILLEQRSVMPDIPGNNENFRLRDLLRFSWFLFDVTIRSMALRLHNECKLSESDRTAWYPISFVRLMKKLVMKLAEHVPTALQTHGTDVARALSSAIGNFVRDLFDVFDRGHAIDLACRYVDISRRLYKQQPHPAILRLRYEFLSIVSDAEAFVALNLPAPIPLDAGVITMQEHLAEAHPLVTLLVSETANAMALQDAELRLKAFNMLATLLSKHDHDVRYQTAEMRLRLARMYLPLLLRVMSDPRRLSDWLDVSDWTEQRRLLISVAYVIKTADRDALVAWWNADTHPAHRRFLLLLGQILDAFAYTPGGTAGGGLGFYAGAAGSSYGNLSSAGRSTDAPGERGSTMRPAHLRQSGDMQARLMEALQHTDAAGNASSANNTPGSTNSVAGRGNGSGAAAGAGAGTSGASPSPSMAHRRGRSPNSGSHRYSGKKTATMRFGRSSKASATAGSIGASASASATGNASASLRALWDHVDEAGAAGSAASSPGPLAVPTRGDDGQYTLAHSSSMGAMSLGSCGYAGAALIEGNLASEVTLIAVDVLVDVMRQEKRLLYWAGLVAAQGAGLTPPVQPDDMSSAGSAASGSSSGRDNGDGGVADDEDDDDIDPESVRCGNELFGDAIALVVRAMQLGQSEHAMTHIFAVLRELVANNAALLFSPGRTSLLQALLGEVLHLGNGRSDAIRQGATAFLYFLIKHNARVAGSFDRIKTQATVALSQRVHKLGSEAMLRRSLRAIFDYALHEYSIPGCDLGLVPITSYHSRVSTSQEKAMFAREVHELVQRLGKILRDTLSVRELQSSKPDPEQMADLYHQISLGYMETPVIRVSWLHELAAYQESHGFLAEAAMVKLRVVAILAQHVVSRTHHNDADVQAGSRKVASTFNFAALEAVCPDLANEWSLDNRLDRRRDVSSGESEDDTPFTEAMLIDALSQTITLLKSADLWEFAYQLYYHCLIPILEKNHSFNEMSAAFADLQTIFSQISRLTESNERVLGTYYRVAFFGRKFGPIDGTEFVYKEPMITHLYEFTPRIRTMHSERIGEPVKIIADSRSVDVSKLDPETCHIQITHVKPDFSHESNSGALRVSYLQRNTDLTWFIFETPFTKTGDTHGAITEQWMRRTRLQVANAFPYVAKRQAVVRKVEEELCPIEHQVNSLRQRAAAIQAEVAQGTKVDAKRLQQLLQGSVLLQVNGGAKEIANEFFSQQDKWTEEQLLSLQSALMEFLVALREGIVANRSLLEPTEHDNAAKVHQALERGYFELCVGLETFVGRRDSLYDADMQERLVELERRNLRRSPVPPSQLRRSSGSTNDELNDGDVSPSMQPRSARAWESTASMTSLPTAAGTLSRSNSKAAKLMGWDEGSSPTPTPSLQRSAVMAASSATLPRRGGPSPSGSQGSIDSSQRSVEMPSRGSKAARMLGLDADVDTPDVGGVDQPEMPRIGSKASKVLGLEPTDDHRTH